ncbi:MAG: DNA-binding protein [Gammaproteobacteria bacterium]|nr:DNA-binding protein [Gammaproteobacteria bacterium]
MPRTGVTRQQVFDAADRLAESGLSPTVVTVRGDLGKGSFTTINQHLSEWKALKWKTDGGAQLPPPVEAKARDLLQSLWVLASHEANQSIDKIREAALGDVAELQCQLEEVQRRTQALAAEREALAAELAKAQAENDALRRQVADLAQALGATSAWLERIEDRLVGEVAGKHPS